MSAHLCLIIQVREGKPQVTGAGIYSSGPVHLTSVAGEYYAELFSVPGDFAGAKETIVQCLRGSPERYSWLYPLISELQ